MEPIMQRTNKVFTKFIDTNQHIATEQSIKFPATFNRGNTYLFGICNYDINSILVRQIKAREKNIFSGYSKSSTSTYSREG